MVAYACLAVMASQAFQAQAADSVAGVWRIEAPVKAVRTVDGKEPPLKPEAAQTYRRHIAARKAGDTSFDSATWCASVGMPRAMFIDSPFQIVVSDPYVAFLHEWNWWARVVYLAGAIDPSAAAAAARDLPPEGEGPPPGAGPPPGEGPPPGAGPPPEELQAGDPIDEGALKGPMGISRGHWEGDALVVETQDIGPLTLIDGAGLPHSDALKVTETLRLRGPDILEDRIRFEDPEVFTRPWETVVTYRRQLGVRIQEDVCLDRIRDGSPAVKE